METWFERHQRTLPWRATYDPYHVWVSEVMLQQTRMEVVLRYHSSFIERFPSLPALAAAEPEEVLAAWSGLGYYRRARMLHAGAGEAVRRFGAALPHDVPSLMTIPGIGRYTAGAIASIAFRRKEPIVDGNVARVLARLTANDAPAASPALMRDAWKEAERLVAASSDARAWNQGLMELGALVCTPRTPRCGECPVRRHCAAHASGSAESYPGARTRRVPQHLVVPLYLIGDGSGRILMRRESGSLMTSMFHLPHGSSALLAGPPLEVTASAFIGAFRHTITTRNVEFRLHAAQMAGKVADGGEYAWIDPKVLGDVPHPSYVAKAIALAQAKIDPCAGG